MVFLKVDIWRLKEYVGAIPGEDMATTLCHLILLMRVLIV
jgi:hypothetical protein